MSFIRHSRVCIDDKRIYLIAEDLEQRSRGSISLTADDCTVSIILVICISDRASGVKKRQEQKVNLQKEMKV